MQQEVAPGCGFKYTANAGKARVYGAELEVAVVLMPGLAFGQNVGYTHADQFDHHPDAGVVAGDRAARCPGGDRQHQPHLQAAAGGRLNLVARVTNSYVDSIQDITFTRNTLPAYDLVGFRPAWRRMRGPHCCSSTT